MRKYKVSSGLRPYINRIAKQNYYSCTMEMDANGQIWCMTNASSDTFHKIVQRAKCEKKSDESGLVLMTRQEFNNPYERHKILKEHGAKICGIINNYTGDMLPA